MGVDYQPMLPSRRSHPTHYSLSYFLVVYPINVFSRALTYLLKTTTISFRTPSNNYSLNPDLPSQASGRIDITSGGAHSFHPIPYPMGSSAATGGLAGTYWQLNSTVVLTTTLPILTLSNTPTCSHCHRHLTLWIVRSRVHLFLRNIPGPQQCDDHLSHRRYESCLPDQSTLLQTQSRLTLI